MSGAIRKGGIYFSNDIYGEIDFTDLENLKLKTIIDGVENEYDVGGGGSVEGFGLIMNPAPPETMKVGDVFNFTLSNVAYGIAVGVSDTRIVEINSENNAMIAKSVGSTNVTIVDNSAKLQGRIFFNVTVTE